MNKHVSEDKTVLDVADKPVRDDAVFVQDDGDYPIDPLDASRTEGSEAEKVD